MKVIANGGAITKNVTCNTMDALILGLNTSYIDGFKYKLYLTKDQEIITLGDDIVDNYVSDIDKICELTLKEYNHFNIGTDVKSQKILSLKEILKVFKKHPDKLLVLQLANICDKALLVDVVLELLKDYDIPNLYLESESKEVIEYLKSSGNSNYKVGAAVTSKSLSNFNLNVDFYDIYTSVLKIVNIRNKIRLGKIIMINQVNRKETFNLIYNEYKAVFDYIYIITSMIANIN